MFEAITGVHWLAVTAAAVVQFVLGGAWFMGVIGKRYGVALGRTDLDLTKPAPIAILGPFVCSVFVITTTAVLLRALGITHWSDAAIFGAVVGLGYLTPMVMNIAINPNFPRPFFYTLLNAPYFVITSIVSSVVVTSMS